jgi:hypothetical protein
MDLYYATIPNRTQIHVTLYNKKNRKEQIDILDYGENQSNYNSINTFFPQDWVSLPFEKEDIIDEVIWFEGGGIHKTPKK